MLSLELARRGSEGVLGVGGVVVVVQLLSGCGGVNLKCSRRGRARRWVDAPAREA